MNEPPDIDRGRRMRQRVRCLILLMEWTGGAPRGTSASGGDQEQGARHASPFQRHRRRSRNRNRQEYLVSDWRLWSSGPLQDTWPIPQRTAVWAGSTEALTRVSDRPDRVSDKVWSEAARNYDEGAHGPGHSRRQHQCVEPPQHRRTAARRCIETIGAIRGRTEDVRLQCVPYRTTFTKNS